MISIGTTARSWAIDMPIASWPASVRSSPTSSSMLMLTTVLLMRHHEAEQHGGAVRPVEQRRDQQHQQHAEADLQGGSTERGLVDVAKGAQRQLHADHEQQHQHAELGEQVDRLAIGDQADPRGPEHRASKDVADQRRLAQARQQQPAGDRADEQERDRDQVEVLEHHTSVNRRH